MYFNRYTAIAVVVVVPRAAPDKLDALEGHPDWYSRRRIAVETAGGTTIDVDGYLLYVAV